MFSFFANFSSASFFMIINRLSQSRCFQMHCGSLMLQLPLSPPAPLMLYCTTRPSRSFKGAVTGTPPLSHFWLDVAICRRAAERSGRVSLRSRVTQRCSFFYWLRVCECCAHSCR
jgi:hypothetical protein